MSDPTPESPCTSFLVGSWLVLSMRNSTLGRCSSASHWWNAATVARLFSSSCVIQ